MRKKKTKNKILKPRIPVWKIKPEQVHRSKKSYSRKKVKKETREMEKLIQSGEKII